MNNGSCAPSARGAFPLIGNLPAFARNPLGLLEECARLQSPVVRLEIPFRSTLLLNDPALVQKVLETHQSSFEKTSSPRDVGGAFGNGVFTSHGQTWLHQRRVLQQAFRQDRIRSYVTVTLEELRRATNDWRPGILDIHAQMSALVLSATPRALFGWTDDRELDPVCEVLDVIVDRFRQEFPVPKTISSLLPCAFPTPANRSLRKAVERVRGLAMEAVHRRMLGSGAQQDVLDLLIADAARGSAQPGITAVRDQVVTLLLTGHETTASALTWMFWLVAARPDIQQAVATEVERITAGRPLLAKDLPSLAYTRQVVLESLRLIPTAWGMNRRCVRDCVLDDWKVPAGSHVAFSQWLLHRDPRFHARPLMFDPDRWSDDPASAMPRYAYFPFGGGARRCLGERLAYAQMEASLAFVVSSFSLGLVSPESPPHQVSVTLSPRCPVWLTLERRARSVQAVATAVSVFDPVDTFVDTPQKSEGCSPGVLIVDAPVRSARALRSLDGNDHPAAPACDAPALR